MKIIHTADWHFREKDHDEINKCTRYIADRALKEEPDLIVISGDITDLKNLKLDSKSARSIFEIISLMLDIAPVAIVIGTPFHDGKAALALRTCRGKYPILVSDMPGQFIYSEKEWTYVNDPYGPKSNPEFILSQIPQPTKQYFITDMSIEDSDTAISNGMDSIFASFGAVAEKFNTIPHIVNGHGQIGGAFISETQQLIGRDIEVSKAQLKMLNADLICYGHVHKAQDMLDGVFYAGSPTRMNYGETEVKGFYLHTVGVTDGEHPDYFQSEFIETPVIYLHDAKFDLTMEYEDFSLMQAIENMCEGLQEDYDDWGCKVTITAWQNEAVIISQAKIEKMLSEYGASRVKVSLIRKPREIVRAVKVLEADTLPDKIDAMAELRGETISESILEKAAFLESGEKELWEMLDK